MGIRFFCPNGHPLNVKTEFAGKKGFCPKCKVKMRIPNESMRAKDEHEYHGQPTAELITEDGSEHKDRESGRGGIERSGRVSDGVESIISRVAATSTAARMESMRGGDSLLALDNPDVLWFVFTSESQQYGPGTGADIRQWLKERRIGPKTLVRRSGWTEAREAKEVFPSNLFALDTPDAESSPDADRLDQAFLDDPRLLESDAVTLNTLSRRQRKAQRAFYLICALIGLIALLLVALIVVILAK